MCMPSENTEASRFVEQVTTKCTTKIKTSVVEEKIVDVPSSPESGCSPAASDDEDDYCIFKRDMFCDRTAAIIDWDDTICPSTHLASLGLRVDDLEELPEDLKSELEELEDAAISILKEALRYGAVIIITNAEAGWVEMSGQRFLPRVIKFMDYAEIKVVSARTTYECDFPNSPVNWKVAAFSTEVHDLFLHDDELNLLVLGDSISERDAAHSLVHQLPTSRIKTVKFVERPSIDQLRRQTELVRSSYRELCHYNRSFDVNLTLTPSTDS